MNESINKRDQELILGTLHSRGLVSAEELTAALGKSQPTVSRALAGLGAQVLALGNARARRYGLPKLIRGRAARQDLVWTDEQGADRVFAVLTFLAGDIVHVDSKFIQHPPTKGLPWFLSPLRAQGFLGRVHARHLQAAGVHEDPQRWDLESILYSALHLHDAPGAVTLGEWVGQVPPNPIAADETALPAALDRLAQDVATTLPAGSSAGGEQAKFLATLPGDQQVLVKFTPPRPSPFGERWHDLLWTEWLAGRVLAEHGVEVAQARMLQSAKRSYLISHRFDRIGARGRRHVVSIGDVHQAFVADAYRHWAATAAELARQGRLAKIDAERASALLGFGRLIGNTDMHSGNLGLKVDLAGLAKGRFRLAPVYDMLPMRWKPNPEMGGAADYTPFEPEISHITRPALVPAHHFWQRLAGLEPVSSGLRQVAAEMAQRLATAIDAASPRQPTGPPGQP